MDRLLETVGQQASSTANAAAEEPFDEGLFQQFMKKKNPFWDFHSLTRKQYLSKNKDQKIDLMNLYYYSMKNGEIHLYFLKSSSLVLTLKKS